MDLLPTNIIAYIFSFLETETICNLLYLNKKIHKACMNPMLDLFLHKKLNISLRFLKSSKESIKKIYSNSSITISNIHTNFFPNISKLKKLQNIGMGHTNILTIPVFKSKTLEYVVITNNKLLNFPVLNNVNNLTFLEIENCELEYFPDITHIVNLDSLSLKKNNIKYIPTIEHNKLRCLDININKITEFPNISKLPNLYLLRISKNLLINIPVIYSNSISILNVSHNYIEDIADISNMPKLAIFYINNNRIKKNIILYSKRLSGIYDDGGFVEVLNI